MWSWDDETPPVSPLVAHRPRPTESLRRENRASAYYRSVELQRSLKGVADDGEREFGWGGNAAAYRQEGGAYGCTKHQTPASQPDLDSCIGQRTGITISALVDPRDLNQSVAEVPLKSHDAMQIAVNRRMQLLAKLRRLLDRLRCKHSSSALVQHSSTSPHRQRHLNSEKEMADIRQFNESVMMKRKARGSIFYSLKTGIAQIPLYSAPDLAQVSQAPALSSFAPIAPIDAGQTRAKAVAQAAATVTADGRVLELKKEKAFVKGNARYSKWLQQR